VDRDQLMFAAGRTSRLAERSWASSWFWPAATVLSSAATILLATMLVWQRNDSQPIDTRPHAAATLAAANDAGDVWSSDPGPRAWPWPGRLATGYLAIRYVALTQGVAALDREFPTAVGDAGEPTPPATAGKLLEELLPKPRQTSS